MDRPRRLRGERGVEQRRGADGGRHRLQLWPAGLATASGVRGCGVSEMERLAGRAVVTGATSGIGKAMAQALLEAGMEVVVAARASARLEGLVAAWRADGLSARQGPVDVRDPASVQDLAARVESEFGAIDLLVNNAGIGMRTVNPRFLSDPMPFFEVPLDGFEDVVRTNLTGYFLVARAFAGHFLRNRRGRIINVTMNVETMQRRGFVPYGPARAGAEALSRIMTEDLRPYGIWVNQILPGGATATGMIPDGAASARLLDPAIMGPPAVFLASGEAEGLTGQRIVAKDFDAWLSAFRSRRQGL